MDYFTSTSPCGLDCFNCRVFIENITPELQSELAASANLPPEEVTCRGCRTEDGKGFHCGGCETYACVQEKGLDFCYECAEFPCSRLAPTLLGAEYPHNTKLYHLLSIQRDGLEAWAKNAATIRKNYFVGKFRVGKGPQAE